jgi:serine/threonine protein phosphatase PrpC
MSVVVGIAQRCAAGETVCGDGWAVENVDGVLLVSVVDGLGHGPMAGEAADAFVASVRSNLALPLDQMMTAAARDLAGTRGAAAALLLIDEARGRIEFTGVGNIELHCVAENSIRPVCAPGVVGHRVRKLMPFEYALPARALLAMCSDGVSSHLHLESFAHLEPQQIAEALLAEHGKSHDDATCVVVLRVDEEPA